MAVTPVASVSVQRKDSTLDKIAKGVGIAANIIDMPMGVMKFLKEQKLANKQLEMAPFQQAATLVNIGSNTREGKEGDPGAINVPTMGWRVPISSDSGENETDRGITNQIKADMEQGNIWVARRDKNNLMTIHKVRKDQLTPGDEINIIKTGAEYRMRSGEGRLGTAAFGGGLNLNQFGFTQEKTELDRIRDDISKVHNRVTDIKTKYQDEIDQLRQARRLMGSGHQIGYNLANSIIARKIGQEKGPLSEGDIQRLFQTWSQGQVQKFTNWINGTTGATISPDQAAALNKIITDYDTEVRSNYARRLTDEVSLFENQYPDAFKEARVTNFVRELEYQNPDFAVERTIRQLDKKKRDVAPEARAIFDQKINELRAKRGW